MYFQTHLVKRIFYLMIPALLIIGVIVNLILFLIYVVAPFTSYSNSIFVSLIFWFLTVIALLNFTQMIATYSRRFTLYFDPYPELKKSQTGLLQLACLDPVVAFKPVASKYRNVVLASANFTPPEIFTKLLDFKCKEIRSFILDTKLAASFCPLILTKANDNVLNYAKSCL